MKSPVLWLTAAAVAVIVAIAVIAAIMNRRTSAWGFKDFVKHPEYWEEVSQAQEEVETAGEAAKRWGNEKVASATRQFVLEVTSSRDAWDQAQILRELGERTHPTVLQLLLDSSLYARLVQPTGKDILPEAPFNRACKLLGDSPSSSAVEALAPFLEDPSEGIRKDAALAIAKTGAASITPLVRKAFSDPDEYVRSYALMGLEFALNRSGLAESVQAELLPDVLALLRTGQDADKAAPMLYRFDAARAKEFFLSQQVFTAESPILHEVLATLANVRSPVPHDRLHALISSLETMEMKYPRTYALGEALRLLGQQQQEEDREFLRTRTTHSEEKVAEGAASGLLCSFGLEGVEQRIWDAERRSGYESLRQHQRLYIAVCACDAEIRNGGLAQYFVNSSGDHWRDAVSGFKMMGFKERLDILNEAVALFGGDGPSTDRSIRQDQLSKLYNRNDGIFEALESRYYRSPEVIGVFASRFVLENPEAFR